VNNKDFHFDSAGGENIAGLAELRLCFVAY